MNGIKLYIAIGIGGMIGATGRYGLSLLFYNNSFPFGTLIANLAGCFLLSFLMHHAIWKKQLPSWLITAFGTGMIGGFTTFSTFAIETIELWNSSFFLAFVYVMISIFGGLAFSFFGYRVAGRKRVSA